MSFAGRPGNFWSVILHTGRTSGKEYTTPIIAARHGKGFVIPLPYGQKVDWFRNVLAAGGCTLIYEGQVYHATQPEVIPFEAGVGAFSGLAGRLLRNSETEAFVHLNQASLHPQGEELYQAFTAAHPVERGVWILAAAGFLLVGIGRLFRRRNKKG
jgi:hypothetical protein